jgi:hypothetical protein
MDDTARPARIPSSGEIQTGERVLVWVAMTGTLLNTVFLVIRQFHQSSHQLPGAAILGLSFALSASVIFCGFMIFWRSRALSKLLDELDATDKALARAEATAARIGRFKITGLPQKSLT